MEKDQVISKLRRHFLFKSLSDDEVAEAANRVTVLSINDGKHIYLERDDPNGFFIIESGKVLLTRGKGDQKQELGTLMMGDVFGEIEFFLRSRRIATATAVGPTRLIRFAPKDFEWLVMTFPEVRSLLEAMIKSYRLAQKKEFHWLGKDEMIHLVARKHIAYLWMSLVAPLVLFSVSLIALVLGFLSAMSAVEIAGVILFVASILWGLWNYLDWGNDYYIVTDKRVVWLEKVIGLYDSRQEAPLGAVLSVDTRADVAQRAIGSGDVVMRTYTGSIVFRNADDPERLEAIINEYWNRQRELASLEDKEAMHQVIQERLLRKHEAEETEQSEAEAEETYAQPKQSFWGKVFVNFFKVRFEENGVITYRKHWFVLLRKTWMPSLAMVLLIGLFGYLLWLGRTSDNPLLDFRLLCLPAFLIGVILFIIWLYNYIDWRNDIYVLTYDKLLDIERKPLGREVKKSAPLESVLSLEHERPSILNRLFNFGNVVINVGSAKLTFFGVFNPSEVQNDIFHRMEALRERQEAEKARRERERMVEWLAAYHEEVENHEKEDENSPDFY